METSIQEQADAGIEVCQRTIELPGRCNTEAGQLCL